MRQRQHGARTRSDDGRVAWQMQGLAAQAKQHEEEAGRLRARAEEAEERAGDERARREAAEERCEEERRERASAAACDAARVREAHDALLAARNDAHRAAAAEAAAAAAARQARADADEAAAAARRGREADCRAVCGLMEAAAVAEEERRLVRGLALVLREEAGWAADMARAWAAKGEALLRQGAAQVGQAAHGRQR
jgi:colicin import membrane protein